MKVFIINFRHLKMGGIENTLYFTVKELLQEDVRIIWFCDKNYSLAEEYKDVFDNEKVEKYVFDTHGIRWGKLPKDFTLHENDEVKVYSFFFLDYLRMNLLKEKFPNVKIDNFYLVPHFTGAVYFPEEEKHILFRKKLYNHTKKIFNIMIANNELKCFAIKHLQTIQQKYDISISNSDDIIINLAEPIMDFDIDLVKAKAKRDNFKIVSVSRLEFPHKGYIMGLMDVFSVVAKKYPQISMDIVAYGVDEQRLLDKIDTLDDDVKRRINFIGKLSPYKLMEEYKSAHINISLAGCASRGAKMGVITLPCRHYTYDCEVYGYYHNCIEKILSTDVGESPIPYIEEVLNCSEDEFVKLSKAGYDAYSNKYHYVPNCLINYSTQNNIRISKLDIAYFKLYNLRCKFNYCSNKLRGKLCKK